MIAAAASKVEPQVALGREQVGVSLLQFDFEAVLNSYDCNSSQSSARTALDDPQA
jgi:hypothetical protein